MNLLRQLLIILSFWAFGESFRVLLNISIPGNVIGMILLFFALNFNIIKLEYISDVSKFLLSYLAFFFIPAGVGLISCLSLISENWLEILIIILVSTILVIASTGLTIQFIQRRSKQ